MKEWIIVLENDFYSKKSVKNLILRVEEIKDNDFKIKVVTK